MLDINKLKEYLDSEEGQANMDKYIAAEMKRISFREYRMNRFHKRVESDSTFFGKFVEATLKKEASDKYRDRYRKKREEPHHQFSYFLYQYACEYGRYSTKAESQKYDIDCEYDSLLFCNGYYFHAVSGQGCTYCHIFKYDGFIEINYSETGLSLPDSMIMNFVKQKCLQAVKEPINITVGSYLIILAFRAYLKETRLIPSDSLIIHDGDRTIYMDNNFQPSGNLDDLYEQLLMKFV